jgi:hypothetical protein
MYAKPARNRRRWGGSALYWMSIGDYTAAGLCFLSASIVIYYRENRLVGS